MMKCDELIRWQDKDLTEYYEAESVDAVLAEKDKTIADLIKKNKRLANKDMIMASETIKDLEESHKMEVEQLLMKIAEMKKACNSKDDWCLHTLKENRHHKYKRCLAMADKCSEAICYWDNVKYTFFKGEAYCFRKMNYYGKWGHIWLAIAEKFKEAY